jgi:UDP-N-acetylglucosamine--N-acetylmuramyl-(pentapeptide) pyrophosphoryl-undecaprenol N-acetylglucosamine transferase
VPKINLPGEHQVMNARALARRGGAVVLYEQTQIEKGRRVETLDGAELAATVLALIGDAPRLREMGAANRGFIERDAIEIIRRTIAGEAVPVAAAADAGGALLGNGALLAALERARAARGRAYTVDAVVPSADDRAFYTSRAASLLASASWETRNLGVKLLGLLQARDRLPLVLALLADRTPAPWYKRMLGGDFEQVGFIRRNAIAAIARLGVVTPAVEQALAAAFVDPYYEVRAEGCRAVTVLDRGLSPEERTRLVAGIIPLLRDRWVEVIAAAAEALGHVGGPGDARPALVALRDQKLWMVRAAGLRGILALVERGQAGDLESLSREIRAFALTATDFRPEFTIRTSFGRVVDAIQAQRSTP